jgi:hypothetical protein
MLPTGRRQRTIALPEGAQVCFFSDGLIEARCEGTAPEALLGRERLRELLMALGSEARAGALLAAVEDVAFATPDDMAACIFTVEAHPAVEPQDVEELELDQRTLLRGSVRELLEACRVPSAKIGAALRQAGAIAAECETAILRIDHARPIARASVRRPREGQQHPALAASHEQRLAV